MATQSIYLCLAESIEKNGVKYVQTIKSLRKKITVDSVHDLRVTIRKIEAALELLDTLGIQDKKLEKELKHIRKIHGALRDIHMELELLKTIKMETGPRAFKNFLKHKKSQQETKLLKKLNLISISNQQVKIKKLVFKLLQNDTHPLDLKAHKLMANNHHQLIKEFKKIKMDYSPKSVKSIHNIRVITKKIRYQDEILKPALNFSDISFSKLKFYQDALGKYQNNAVLQKSSNKYLKKHGKIGAKSVFELQMYVTKEQNILLKRINNMKLK